MRAILFDGAGDVPSEHFTVDGERVATGYARLLCHAQQQRIQASQFFFQ